jgi:hypothetical protein
MKSEISFQGQDGNVKTIRVKDFDKYKKKPVVIRAKKINEEFMVKTLEGMMVGRAGDFLVIGIAGEVYPVAAKIFKMTYEKVE